MSRILADLLNPSDTAGQQVQASMQAGLVDIQPQLQILANFRPHGARATPEVQQQLIAAIEYLGGQELHHPPPPLPPPFPEEPPPDQETNVRLSSKTTLSILYRHPLNTIIEYPETSNVNPVGHLFRMDPNDWQVPDLNIAYSRGAPMGRTVVGREVFLDIDESGEFNTGNCVVACSESHTTCQGVKVCPFADIESLSKPHTRASRANIQTRLRQDRDERLQHASPSKDVFCKTGAYLTAIRKLGCSRPLDEQALQNFVNDELTQNRDNAEYWQDRQRGYRPKEDTCKGRILFERDSHGNPHVRCEFYCPKTSRDHFHDDCVGGPAGSYDLNYIQAVLSDDEEEISDIEEAAFVLGYGPLVQCTTVTNASSQRAFCPHDHRKDGQLIQPLMQRLKCDVKFRMFEPLEENRSACPYVLIVSSGVHTHPIPLPTKTPPAIRSIVLGLLEDLGVDLPDMTPRRFIRHPNVRTFLAAKFPHTPHPTLSHLHVSLSNRSHVKAYIRYIKDIHCPHGTGWAAIEHLKKRQDAELPAAEHYIRRIMILDPETMAHHEEDDDDQAFKDSKVRIIICMSPQASYRLLEQGSYLQSDIAFKRIIDFLEFEMGAMDRDANSSINFCRVFLNRQSAVAHQKVFQAIDDIVFQDTGKRLKWRHLHANHIDDFQSMVLQWGADQHRGQAKGLGLYLQALAWEMPWKQDLHEPHRSIQSLSPYEHLHRVFRLCSNHYYRNIKSNPAPEDVKRLMRSLLCMEHVNWDGTLAAIEEKGGKAGRDWVKDKRSSHFAFEAICWERSFIPWAIWKAGDPTTNLIESVHRDANLEGVHCTLLGGLQKGQALDSWKIRTLELYETYGIRPTYLAGHISENAFSNLRRRDNAQRRALLADDQRIHALNEKLQKSYEALCKARQALIAKLQTNLAHHDITEAINRLTNVATKAEEAYMKHAEEAKELVGRGTGKVVITFYDITP